MAALTAERDTKHKEGILRSLPVAANAKIYQGSLVAVNASSVAVPGSVSTTQKVVGRAEETVDNTGGADGDKRITVRRGIFQFANSASGDLIALKDIGANAYIVDDQTVALTNGSSTRSIAGVIHDVDANGVWIKI